MIDLPGTVSKLNELKFTRDDLSGDPIRSFKDADSQQFLCALQVHPDIHSFIFTALPTHTQYTVGKHAFTGKNIISIKSDDKYAF